MSSWELPIVAAIEDDSSQLVVKARKNGPADTDYLIDLEIYTAALPVAQITSERLDGFGLSGAQMAMFHNVTSAMRQYLLEKAGYTEVE